MSLTILPAEILDYLFSFIDDKSKSCLAQTCKKFHEIVIPSLYESLSFTDYNIEQLHQILFTNPPLALYCRSVTIEIRSWLPLTIELMTRIAKLLNRATNLKLSTATMNIDCVSAMHYLVSIECDEDVVKISEMIRRNVWPNLKEISTFHLYSQNLTDAEIEAFEVFVQNDVNYSIRIQPTFVITEPGPWKRLLDCAQQKTYFLTGFTDEYKCNDVMDSLCRFTLDGSKSIEVVIDDVWYIEDYANWFDSLPKYDVMFLCPEDVSTFEFLCKMKKAKSIRLQIVYIDSIFYGINDLDVANLEIIFDFKYGSQELALKVMSHFRQIENVVIQNAVQGFVVKEFRKQMKVDNVNSIRVERQTNNLSFLCM